MRALVKALLSAGSVGVLIAAASSCAATRAAGDHIIQLGGSAGGGALFYVLATMGGVAGWAAAGLAGIGGWIGAWFVTPRAVGAPAPGFPWGILVLGAVAFALVRAWAHYPAIFKNVLALAKTAARGILGGRTNGPQGS